MYITEIFLLTFFVTEESLKEKKFFLYVFFTSLIKAIV